jgi:hypothetical protein
MYPKGYYPMHGESGFAEFNCLRQIPITMLAVNERVLMWDEPPHWYGIKRCAKKMHGRVLVAGLGLGLIAHALKSNPAVEEVVIVENNKDVIDLIGPVCPSSMKIEHADWYTWGCSAFSPDSVLVDLADGDYDAIRVEKETHACMLRFPSATSISVHGSTTFCQPSLS